ncbi:DUF4349 domain-containing protein [Mucilaginibacter flavidus]|uniref:DUF4349 domain-containing protein n=1 Tax=Mucilaginibacter flavidus TaxID=2949309 RepID=UPI0020938748|nr:DUF4349 domain-containing protein [Mucilaginibacter flavidus]MCO5945557.1 DUF4349 domain-containing protein [Mucilaginibacter flavidus]
MKKTIYPALLVLVLAACGNSSVKDKVTVTNLALKAPLRIDKEAIMDAKMAEQPASSKESMPPATNNTTEVSKKIIKEGDINFETNDTKQTRNSIFNALSKLGGYISDENETNSSDYNRKEFNLKIRVPAKNFDQFLNGVTAIAVKIDSKNIRIKDVTAEYIDINSQLTNKKKLEERYLELLKKANKMADLLEIENKLTEIRTDIESTQGRLNYLVKQVDYSSLDITFYTKQIAVQDNGNTFGYRLKSALADGWIVLGGLFFGFIQVWPIWILFGIVIYLIRAWRRRRRNRQPILVNNGEK